MKYLASFMIAIFTETVVGICGMVVCGYTFMIADDR